MPGMLSLSLLIWLDNPHPLGFLSFLPRSFLGHIPPFLSKLSFFNYSFLQHSVVVFHNIYHNYSFESLFLYAFPPRL